VIVVDASVWINAFVAAEHHHAVSRQLLRETVDAGEMIGAPAVLPAEVGGALARRLSNTTFARTVIENLMTDQGVVLFDVDQALASSSAAFAAELRLRGYDAVYVAPAWSLGVPLVTLDSDHLQRASGRITVWTPQAALDEIIR
jgi:predicted nucleic acid-binding protein